ncbi:MAG: (2Fe-2S) ferredoxin domain-containing protein [Myxococcales bacterium]|nr:(2Fe-2S) ferredoxin domain-containing protein [Myxococcales bacterium]
MKAIKRPYEVRQLLVCTNARDPSTGKSSCGQNGAQPILEYLKKTVKERGLKGKVIVTKTGCLDICPDDGCIVGFQPEAEFFRVACTIEEADAVLTRLTAGL